MIKKLHLACGSVYKEGWINIDLTSKVADLQLDLTKPLPFNENEIKYIFCEHFIEHLSQNNAIDFLKECFRILEVDGVIRLSTPNLKFLAYTYIYGLIDEWGELWSPKTAAHLLNDGMRLWGHKFLYDAEELARLISNVGFGEMHFYPWAKSNIHDFNNIETRKYHNELIIEAKKVTKENFINVDMLESKKIEGEWKSKIEDKNLQHINKLDNFIIDLSRNKIELEKKQMELLTQINELENRLNKYEQIE